MGLAPRVAQQILVVTGEHPGLAKVIEQPAEDLARDGTGHDRGQGGAALGDERDEPVAAGPRLAERDQATMLARLLTQTAEGRPQLAIQGYDPVGSPSHDPRLLGADDRSQLG